MKNLLFSYILFFLGNALLSQSIGIHVAPNTSKFFSPFGTNEYWGFGYNSGVSYELKTQCRLKIETGLFYNQYTSKEFIPNCVLCDLIYQGKVKFKHNYLGIPLNIKIRLGELKEKFNMYPTTGYSYNFYLNTKYPDNIKKSSDYEPNIHSFNLGLEFVYNLRKKITLSTRPNLVISTNNIVNLVHHYKTFSLDFKLAYSLKKTKAPGPETQF